MNSIVKMSQGKLAAMIGLCAAVLALPLSAGAQPVPSYAVQSHEEQVRGTISGFDGAYTMYVHDSRGYTDNVSLHKGTVINPTGLRLQPGMPVTVTGYANGPSFVADQIDVPYYPRPYARWYAPRPYWYGPPPFFYPPGYFFFGRWWP